MKKAQEIRNEIQKYEYELTSLKNELKRVENNCDHNWDTKYDPIVKQGFMSEGDPVGTMGVDWRGPSYVSGSTTPRWIRTCQECGKKEETSRVDEQKEIKVIKNPIW